MNVDYGVGVNVLLSVVRGRLLRINIHEGTSDHWKSSPIIAYRLKISLNYTLQSGPQFLKSAESSVQHRQCIVCRPAGLCARCK